MFKKSFVVAAISLAALAGPMAVSANAKPAVVGIAKAAGASQLLVRARYSATPRINRRIRRQARRIRRGRRDGSLNRYEARRLRHGLRRIQRARLAAARDGYVSRFERRRLHRRLDRNSRRIWRLRHNAS
jgi:hypothetical protein